MGQIEQAVGQAEVVEDLHDARVQGVAPKLAVEVLVGFEQDDRDTLSRTGGSRA